MPIGYIGNLSNIQQGQQQVVNSMAGLGQSISQAIENHAATESAKAMLPIIQNQYLTGMQKIAQGKQEGIADIIQAASLASQNPRTAHMGQNMMTGMTQLNEFTRAKQLADSRVLGAQIGYAGRIGAAKLAHPVDAQGNPIPKGETANETATRTAAQRSAVNKLWSGTSTMSGARDYAQAFIKGEEDASKFAEMLNQYLALKKDRPGFSDPNFENVINAKRAYDRGIASGKPKAEVDKMVLDAYSKLSPVGGNQQAIPAPSGAVPATQKTTVPLPEGLQINPSINTGVPLTGGGGQLPAVSGNVPQSVVSIPEEQSDDETTPEEDTEEQLLTS
jgi:hypothetical protein